MFLRRSAAAATGALRCAAAALSQAASALPGATLGQLALPSSTTISELLPAVERHQRQRWRQLGSARQASGGGGGGGSTTRTGSSGVHPPAKLQAWLEQQQGLSAADAEYYAGRLVRPFRPSEEAALESLPATFAFLRGKGLSGLQTAQLIDFVADQRHDSVANFAATAQLDYELIDSYIAAQLQQRQQQAGAARHRKHASLADVLRSSRSTALALSMPPGHVAEWLKEVGKQLSAAEIGRLLLTQPHVVIGKPATARAAVAWAAEVLGVEDLGSFLARRPSLLASETATLQARFDVLQRIVPAEQARQMARKWPRLVSTSSGTMQAAAAWLRQRIASTGQLHEVLLRCPALLAAGEGRLERNARYLAGQLGWQPGDGQLAKFILRYSQAFATLDYEGPDAQLKLQFFTSVVGVPHADCLGKHSSYLRSSLEAIVACYMLVQERAPWRLYDDSGALSLSWVYNAPQDLARDGVATAAEVKALTQEWPRSEAGQRLLAELRGGRMEGLPRPPPHAEAVALRQQAGAGPKPKSHQGAARPTGRRRAAERREQC